MTKKILSVFLIFSIIITLAGCNTAVPNQDSEKLSIVCTTFAAYDWTREIVGNKADEFQLTLLGDGADLHSFQPTTEDIAKIHTADLFVQIGGTTEEWTNDIYLGDKALKLFDLLDEGEKLCVNEEHTNHTNHQHSDNEFDEHIWLSLKLAQPMVNGICERICDLDTANGAKYQKNCAEYIEKLKSLDKEYKSAVEDSKDKTVIFADRFPFAYLMEDYDIVCYSAFEGCSSDTNASFDTIAHLTEDIKTYNKDTVLVLENSAESVVEPLKSALSGRTLETAVMNSCQSIDKDTAQNTSYIEIMTKNLNSLKKALRG